ncbi:Uncharacterised protein [Mycoplasmopsis pulmonis]|nr:Uncharacterised protein [Mycoplasmopsis pulmonis]
MEKVNFKNKQHFKKLACFFIENQKTAKISLAFRAFFYNEINHKNI